jgi:flagellar motor switch protein FliN/FliY
MISQNLTPSSWLPYISKAIIEAEEIPLIQPLKISTDQLAKNLSSIFQTDNILLDLGEFRFRGHDDILSDMGTDVEVLHTSLPPLEGNISVVFDSKDFKRLINLSMNIENSHLTQDIIDAYRDYFFIKLMNCIESSTQLSNLSIKLASKKPLDTEAMLTLDGVLKISNNPFAFRLALSPLLRKSLKEYQLKEKFKPSNIPPHIPIDLSCSIGKVVLSLQEWQTVNEGDFIIVDSFGFDPYTKKGNLILSYKHNVLFHGELSESKVKISSNTVRSMEADSMANDPSKNQETHEQEKDSSFFLGEDEDFFQEDEELTHLLNEAQTKTHTNSDESEQVGTAKEENHDIVKAESKKPLSSQDIPINIKIEIAHLTLTAKELLEIQPGNEFSLGRDVDSHVDLVVSGKCIAKAELIKIGDVLGVRILSL